MSATPKEIGAKEFADIVDRMNAQIAKNKDHSLGDEPAVLLPPGRFQMVTWTQNGSRWGESFSDCNVEDLAHCLLMVARQIHKRSKDGYLEECFEYVLKNLPEQKEDEQ